ncbi:MAG: ribonuclease P protein component [Planctomycetaceae bacterium]|nr:ribonuclease P protein component [Planctomycetaceae bacterium]
MPAPRFTFGAEDRLKGRTAFSEVHGGRTRRESGPLLVYAIPNGLERLRLGLSVGRRCGNAVGRNRFKRLLRETFRLNRGSWPVGYDLLVVVRPHEELSLAAYAAHLESAIQRLDETWRKRHRKRTTPPADEASPPSA